MRKLLCHIETELLFEVFSEEDYEHNMLCGDVIDVTGEALYEQLIKDSKLYRD